MSGSGANLPIAIRVEGGAAAEAVFNSVAATGERAMQRVSAATGQAAASGGNLRNVVGQAGYQIQDFSVQVQGGTSALTALSQQGSQFLGIFGPAGAIAGAVLTVGILAARFLELGKAQEDAKFAAEAYTRAMQASNEAMQTGAERSREQAANARREAYERLTLAMAVEREALARANAAAGRIAEDNAAVAGGRAAPDMFSRGGARTDAAARIAANAEQASQRLVALQGQLDAMGRQGIDLGMGRMGPDPLESPRASGGRTREVRDSIDLEAALAAATRDAAQGYEEFNRALYLNEAGLSGAAGALRQYEGTMATLEAALANGIITEQQFTADVEASTLALGRQIEEIEQRGQRAGDAGRAFAMTFNSALEDIILKGGEASDVLKAIEQDIARIVLRQAVTAPLTNAIAGATKSIDLAGMFSGLFSGKADGGPVYGGTTYLVGERGPELFTPAASGNITPNHALGGGGQAITYAPTINVDARGSDAATLARARIEAQAIARASVAEFAQSIQSGGSAARLVGRR